MAALRVRGSVRVPGDKSISHRALIIAALAEGESRIRNILVSSDVAATAMVLREMSVALPPLSDSIHVAGRGLRGLAAPGTPLECGNSGTTARLVAGLVAGHAFSAHFVGDASLSRRPMHRVALPLQAMGARVEFADGDGLPMTVHGGDLRPVEWTLETPSAQVKGAVLLAALVSRVSATVRGIAGSRDHTERMLSATGVSIRASDDEVTIEPADGLPPLDLTVPGDPSSAAYFAAAAAIADAGEIELSEVSLNPTRVAFFEMVQRMGAEVRVAASEVRCGEPVGSVHVRSAGLSGVTIAREEAAALIDELPLLGCIASVAAGETVVTGAGELRVKESDRIAAVVQNLRALGGDAEELPDGFVVRSSSRPLRGQVKTYGDHRIAMAFGVLARRTGNEITVDDPGCVAVSYPGFWQDLERVAS